MILVECDLRQPAVATTFSIPRQAGVFEIIVGRATLDDVLIDVSVEPGVNDAGSLAIPVEGGRLRVLTAAAEQPSMPGELFSFERFGALVTALRLRADLVIFDSAPLLAVGDTIAIGHHVPGVLLVVRDEGLSDAAYVPSPGHWTSRKGAWWVLLSSVTLTRRPQRGLRPPGRRWEPPRVQGAQGGAESGLTSGREPVTRRSGRSR